MKLLILAAIGFLVPGGLFLYWMLNDYTTLAAALSDRMAVAFATDLVISTLLLGYLFARRPLGPVRWPWFLVLSFLGTLAFGIPMYLWLNWRRAPGSPSFAAWWRTI